jgi:hypothetical protein
MPKLGVLSSAIAAMVLAGCSIDRGATWAPEVLKAEAPVQAQPEAAPDVRLLLKTKLSEFFLPSAAPSNISFSAPRRIGSDWHACVRATVKGAMGGSTMVQTFAVTFLHSTVLREEHTVAGHWCDQERFEAL